MEGGDIHLSRSIDNRVVSLEFDNKQFQAGVKETLSGLELLKKSLQMDGTLQGAQGLNSSLDGIAGGVDKISSRFSAMGAVAFTVIQNLTNSALNFAKRVGGALTEPLIAGGKRRAENIEQAKFQFRGLGMDIDATMASALEAVTGTAFGLDEAARAAGQFGASGMEAGEDMTTALRAISGVAAMTNSSYSDTADIFTKVAGNGRVMGDDLLRLSSRGLNAAATLADSMGISEAAVREMVTEGKISFEEFYQAMDAAFGENATKANETYAGSLANMRAALSRIGANFFTPWLEQQRDLFNALSPAIDAVGEALKPVISRLTGFTGGKTKGLISFINGLDFSQLNQIFTPVMGTIQNIFQTISSFLGPIKDAFRQIFPPASVMEIAGIFTAIEAFTSTLRLSGETADNFRRTMAGVFAVLGIGWEIVKAGVRFLFELFGVVTEGSGGFLAATASVGDFLVALHQAIKNGEGLQKFFSGLVQVLKGPIELIKRLALGLAGIFDFKTPSSDAFSGALAPLGALGEFLMNIWGNVIDMLGRGVDAIGRFFGAIGDFLRPMKGWFEEAFGPLNFDTLKDMIDTGLLAGIFLMFQRFADNLSNSFGSIQYNLTEPFKKLTFALSTMQNTLRAMTLMQIAIAIALMAGSLFVLSKIDAAGLARGLGAITIMIGQLVAALAGFSIIGGIKGLAGIGTGLILFAVALRILTSSVKALAELSWEDLAKGLVGVTVLIAALVAAVDLMHGQEKGMIKVGASLLILAVGIRVLASAVGELGALSWEEMAKGLIGVGVLLASLAIFTNLVALNSHGTFQAVGILLLAVAIRVLASAVTQFAKLDWNGIAKGLVSITAILAAFMAFSNTVGNPAKLVGAGAALIMIGVAMKILASAMRDFGGMAWEEIAKGLFTMAAALTAISFAMLLMPPNMLASAAALVVVSVALGLVANAVQQMGGMTWGEIARGLTTLAASLLILAVGMAAMMTALPGAAATLVVAGALAVLTPVLRALGGMSLGEIAKSLGVLAGVFVILGVAGMALAAVAPVLLVIGAGIALIGVGAALAGAGVAAFAAGLGALAAAGAAGTAAMVMFVTAILKMVPQIARAIGQMIVGIVTAIGNSAAAIFRASTQIMQSILRAVIANTPKIVRTIIVLAQGMLRALTVLVPAFARTALTIMLGVLRALSNRVPAIVRVITNLVVRLLRELTKGVPKFAKAATDLIVAVLRGIERNIGRVVTAGADIIIALIKGISRNMNRIAEAGADAVIDFVNGVARTIRRKSGELRAAGRNLASAIITGMTGGLGRGVAKVAGKAREMARNAIGAAKRIFGVKSPSTVFAGIGSDVGQGLANGLEDSGRKVGQASEKMSKEAILAMKESMAALSELADMDGTMHPTITPVLDLTQFSKEAQKMRVALTDPRMEAALTHAKAKDASMRYMENVEASRVPVGVLEDHTPAVTYIQNNHSPKALTPAEIYRQTKNQLATTKGKVRPGVA
jgi:tape measure domain-containing protein